MSSTINYISKRFLLLIIIISTLLSSYGQKPTKEEKKARRDSIKSNKIEQGKFLATPIAAPGYTPELGFLIAAGGLFSFLPTRSDSVKTLRSSMPFTIAYTSSGAVVFSSKLTSYWWNDFMRLYGDFWYKNMPDNYWGVGYDKGSNTVESDSTTAYNREWFWINPRFLFRVKKHFYVGLNVDFNYTRGSDESPGVLADPIYRQYTDKPFNSGLGVIVQYDTRDFPQNAWKGMFFNLDATFYGSYLGGDNVYQIYNFDYRQYQNVWKKGKTLAWQVRTRIGQGDVPFGEMSQLGTPFDLRGYAWGRYRDESMAFFLVEYRNMFTKKDGTMSKHGVIGWIGAGTIWGLGTTEESGTKALPNFGVGYRFEVQPRMNLRLDYGIGRETTGFYFSFLESF